MLFFQKYIFLFTKQNISNFEYLYKKPLEILSSNNQYLANYLFNKVSRFF